MNEIAEAVAGRRVILLVKAQKFAGQAGYYLLNGRWHSVKGDKPVPKGAPQAAHPHAAGTPVPVKHFEEHEWDQLKLPAENVNAGTYNKQLATLKQHSESGDVTAILGSGYGVNTYGKKLATVANHLLGLHGSEHKVVPGQKAGEHAAVSQTPVLAPIAAAEPAPAPHIEPEAPHIAEPAPHTAGLTMPEFAEGKKAKGVKAYYEAKAQQIIDLAAAGDVAGLTAMVNAEQNSWQGKTPNSKALLQLHAASLQQAGGKTEAPAPAAVSEPAPAAPAAQALTGEDLLHLPHGSVFQITYQGKPWRKAKIDNGDIYLEKKNGSGWMKEKLTPSQAGMMFAGEYGDYTLVSKPAAEPTSAEKVKQATAAASAALASDPEHQEAVAIAEKVVGTATSMLDQIPWDGLKLPDSNTNAKSHNGKVEQIKAMAYAGDVAGLEAFKAGKNTYGQKQNKLAQAALVALKEGAPAAEQTPTPAAAVEEGPQDGDTKPGADGTLVFKDGHWHKQDEPAVEPVAEAAPKPVAEPEPAKPEPTMEEQAAKVAAYLTSKGDSEDHAEGKALFEALTPEQQHAITLAAIANEAKAAGQHPLDAVPMPDLSSIKNPNTKATVVKALEQLKEQVKAEGAGALKGLTKKMSATGKLITKLTHPHGGQFKVTGYEHAPNFAGTQIHAYVEGLKAAAGKPAKAKAKPTPTVTPAPHADQTTIPSMDGWSQIGPQGGSNPGGKFKDPSGTEWYCKFPGDADVAKSEVLAAKLYAAAGVSGQDAMLVTKDGKLGIASKWQDVKKAAPAQLAGVDGVAAGFATDAWLGNWDVVGLDFDNLQVDAATGKAMRVDAGGSLQYRAQGGKKAFGNSVLEVDSLRDSKINPQAAKVFGHLTDADITASVAKVLKVSDAQIHALVNTYGPGDAANKKALAETLIARKADLLAKYPKAKKEKKHTFKPEKISEPPSFLNWGGSGKDGPSSKSFLNEANEKAVQEIYAAAKTGSIDAVKGLSAETYNKATGEVTGSAPVLDHPSQHVKGYAQQAINEINYQLNPPKRFRFEGGHPLHSLNAAYPSHKGPPHSDAVEKAGKFLVLGEPGTVSLATLDLPKVTFASGQLTRGTYSPAAQASIAKMPGTQKEAIKTYTGSSYKGMNNSLWSGNPSGAAKAAGEALHTASHDITPGTVLSRKLTVHGEGLDQILKSTGKVLQEPAIMSTSIRPSSWSGNVQLKLHVGPGVKGLWVGKGSLGGNSALSVNSGEDELILPPNTRLLILSVKKSGGSDADGFGADVQHVVEAVVLPTQQASV